MSGQSWLIDTNVLSTFVRRDGPTSYPKLSSWVAGLIRGQQAAISAVTRFELRRGIMSELADGKSRRKAARLELLLRSIPVIGLDGSNFAAWDIAATVWAGGRAQKPAVVLDDADLLIFATAVANGRVLATADASLVERVHQLGQVSFIHLVELS